MSERRLLPAVTILAALVALVYGQTLRHEFINYDDDLYVYANDFVRHGFTREGLAAAFGFQAGNWHPLTWVSHMLDVELFGLRAGGHHAVSAALHAGNAALVLLALHAATGAFWRSLLVAALFAVHPQRVESVAWAAERKDVLSAAFWLLSTLAWVRFVRRPGAGRYLAALGFFALGLAAKPMPVTLPFALLLLDAWPLGRLHASASGTAAAAWRRVLLEKVPFFVLSAASVVVTVLAQTRGVIPFVRPELADRLANAAVSWASYVGTFLWPRGLALLYPFPRAGVPAGEGLAATALLLALTAGALFTWRRRPYLAAGWFWYLGTLVPVIGILQVGAQARADRYTYLPLLGFALALAWLAGSLWPRGAAARLRAAALAACWVGALAAAAIAQAGLWRDSLTILGHTAGVTRDNVIVLNNLGEARGVAGRVDEAVATFREAARIDPGHCNASYNLGYYLLKQNRPQEALGPLEHSLACYQRRGSRLTWITDALSQVALANLQLGRYASAERNLLELLGLDPGHAWARLMLPAARERARKR